MADTPPRVDIDDLVARASVPFRKAGHAWNKHSTAWAKGMVEAALHGQSPNVLLRYGGCEARIDLPAGREWAVDQSRPGGGSTAKGVVAPAAVDVQMGEGSTLPQGDERDASANTDGAARDDATTASMAAELAEASARLEKLRVKRRRQKDNRRVRKAEAAAEAARAVAVETRTVAGPTPMEAAAATAAAANNSTAGSQVRASGLVWQPLWSVSMDPKTAFARLANEITERNLAHSRQSGQGLTEVSARRAPNELALRLVVLAGTVGARGTTADKLGDSMCAVTQAGTTETALVALLQKLGMPHAPPNSQIFGASATQPPPTGAMPWPLIGTMGTAAARHEGQGTGRSIDINRM